MKMRTIYIAFDETHFDSAEECKAYEAAHVESLLVGLTSDQIRAAVLREDVELADALEEIGNRIAKARREAGDLRRGRRAAVEAEPQRPESDPQPLDAAPQLPSDKMAEALSRARAAGLLAWEQRRGAVVPEAWSGAKPLADAWLDGWREGQTGAAANQTDGVV